MIIHGNIRRDTARQKNGICEIINMITITIINWLAWTMIILWNLGLK